MLLSYLKSWSQNNDSISLRGSNHLSDTTVTIDIDFIRKANIKLIEHKYLLKLYDEQDSIIDLKNNYIIKQNEIIDTLQNRIINNQIINNSLQKDIKKQNNKIKIYSIGGFLIGVIVGLIIN